jgi:hypothetical protein
MAWCARQREKGAYCEGEWVNGKVNASDGAKRGECVCMQACQEKEALHWP